MDMDIALPRYGEGPKFSKVTKFMRGKNVIPIGRSHENLILDTRFYNVEYLYRNKSSLAANTIAKNIFSQFDKYGDTLVLFDDKVYHCVDGKDNIQ